jgi:drug/metabolite transporter (DMT)-like permease
LNVKTKSTLMLIILVTIWGATFPFEKMVLSHLSPFTLNFFRFLFADLLVLLLFFPTVKKDLKFVWKDGIILGTFMSAGYILQTWGLAYTTSSKSGFITALYIVLIPFFSLLIEKTRLNFVTLFALALATMGIYLSEMTGSVFNPNVGDLLTVGCAVAFAIHVVLTTGITKKLKDKHISLTFFQMGFVALANLPFYAFTFSKDVWHFEDVALIAFVAIFASLMALIIQMKHQKNVGTVPSAFIYAGEPLSAAIFSYLLLRESFSRIQLIGFSLIIFSAILTHLKATKEESEV